MLFCLGHQDEGGIQEALPEAFVCLEVAMGGGCCSAGCSKSLRPWWWLEWRSCAALQTMT